MRLVEAGITGADEPLELVAGELVLVTPQGPGHGGGVTRLVAVLGEASRQRGLVLRPQLPLDCGVDSLPEPDLAIVRGSPEDFDRRHPRGDEAVLVVEVSVTSQPLDRWKAGLYARAGVSRYWLFDVPARVAWVHEGPRPDGVWTSTPAVGEDAELELPRGGTVPVSRLLPA